jgi:hypothetical protein
VSLHQIRRKTGKRRAVGEEEGSQERRKNSRKEKDQM